MKKIIFIAGRGRSGSTLLGKVFDSIPQVFHVGELRYLSQIGYLENRECECGSRLASCQRWGKILNRIQSKFDPKDIYTLSKSLPTHAELYLRKMFGMDARFNPLYLSFIKSLYEECFEVAGCDYIVDSTKFPVYLLAMIHTGQFNIKVIHLTRDPRGTSSSWSKKRQSSAGQSSDLVGQHSFVKESLKWRIWNRLLSRLLENVEHSIHVRWEDFTAHPISETERIVSQLKLDLPMPEFLAPSCIRLDEGHAFWGNSSRRLSGPTEIKREEAWTDEMGAVKGKFIYNLAGASKHGYVA